MTSDVSLLSDLFADISSRQKFVDNVVDVLQAFTSCGCVGIRVLHSDGSLPYQSYSGFSHDFWITENCLSLKDECVCTRLIKDSVEPIDQTILSEDGSSVWTNELQAFAHSIPAHLRDCYRGKCVQSGFESLGVIILKGNQEAVGMIHIADSRQGMLPPEKMRAIESLSNVIGAVILRFRIEDELRSAIEIAEKASKSKSEFLANMSHEIRTPMTVTLGALDILSTSRLDQEQYELVDMAANSAHNLLSLINDILDFSKIEARKVELAEQVCALRPCLEKTVKMFVLEAERKGLDLVMDVAPGIPEFALVDPYRLHQIMTNLLSNAVKFTENGRITLGIRPDKDGLTFYVEDSGIGIPPDKLDHLFASFTQADASITRKYGGTGLGLAISKGLVELMGATIEVKSREGEGSLFYFTVPLRQFDCAPSKALKQKSLDTSLLKDVRILLVEDESAIRQTITTMLQNLGCLVVTAGNGEEAFALWERIRDHDFDLILMDLQMPQMGGLEATRLIRERAGRTDNPVPIVAITAHASHEDERKCLEAGMDAWITKPISISKLHSLILNYKTR